MDEAERSSSRELLRCPRLLRAAGSWAGILSSQGAPSNALSLQATSAKSLSLRAAPDLSSLYGSGATPSRDLTSQSSFLRLLASSRTESTFSGRYLEAREAAKQQLSGDISAKLEES